MPEISYSPQVQPEALPGRPFPHIPGEVPAGAFGGEIGRGIEYAGQEAQRGTEQAMQAAEAAQRQAQQTQHADIHNQLQDLSNSLQRDPQTGALTKQGKNAFNLSGQYLPQFDEQAGKILSQATDPKVAAAARNSLGQIRNQFKEQLDSHEISQHRALADKTDQDTLRLSAQTIAGNYNHPDIIHGNFDGMDKAIENMGERHGWTDEMVAETKREQHSKTHTDVIDTMLTDDKPQMAQHYLNAFKADMDPHAAWAASKTIEAHVKQKENEAKADIAGRYQDSLLAAEAGLSNPLTVTRGEMQTLYPKDGARRWDGLQTMQQAGAQTKAYDKMTPEEISADLKGRAPTEGGPEVAYRLKAQEMLERAANKSLTARREDPAQFAITRGGWSPLNFSNVQDSLQQLQKRASTAGEISNQIGYPVPLLTKDESKGLAGALERAAPSDAAALLGSLHQALPSESAFDSLVSQIAPHAPSKAVAASLMDLPKQDAPAWYDRRFAADPRVSAGILDGERVLSVKGENGERKPSGFKIPADNDLLPIWQAASGGARSDLFAGRPETAAMYFDAYKAYYAHLAAEKGSAGGTLDRGMAEEAAQGVLGNVSRYNHSDLIVPQGLDPSRFEDLATKGIREAAIDAGYTKTEAEPLTGMGLRELGGQLGSGRYAVVDGNGRVLTTKDRTAPVIVDLHRVAPGQSEQRSFLDRLNLAAGAAE